MSYVFFGTPRFAAIVLKELLAAGLPPVALVCNPDRPAGRKKMITPPPTKELAVRHGSIRVLQPEKLDADFAAQLKTLRADLFVVAAYAKIIPKAVLDIPRLGTLGIHPSLLPKYRGASPIQSAILDGESETGVTIYKMDEKTDHGPIIASGRAATDSLAATYGALEEKLAKLGGTLAVQTLPDFAAGKIKPVPQDESHATYTKKFTTEDGFIEETELAAAERGGIKAAELITRKINALNPEPGAWTVRNGVRTKLLAAEIKNGALKLTNIQEAGGKPKRL